MAPYENDSVSRRALLAGGGAVGGLTLLGGIGWWFFQPPDAPEPVVPDEELTERGWAELRARDIETTRQFGPLTVTTAFNRVSYRHEQLIQRVRSQPVEVTTVDTTSSDPLSSYVEGVFTDPLRIFSATRIDISPSLDDLPLGLAKKEVMNRVRAEARERFVEEMQETGLIRIDLDDEETIEVDTGQTADTFVYTAAYPFEGADIPVEDTVLRLEGTNLDVRAYLAIWEKRDHIMIGAGAHPEENYQHTAREQRENENITAFIDLGLEPNEYEDETLDLIRRIE
jgi:hypothetical protein